MQTIVDGANIVVAICAVIGVALAYDVSKKSLRSAEELTRETRLNDLRSELFSRSLEVTRELSQMAGVLELMEGRGSLR